MCSAITRRSTSRLHRRLSNGGYTCGSRGICIAWGRCGGNAMPSRWHQRLCDEGWRPATEPFWESTPCFYDLGTVKTVILFKNHCDATLTEYAKVFYWKYGGHDIPDYLK